ncbi:MAG: TIM barrel protein [Acidobacteria bacterium]|nr:TIM barrel protein [Acidobacteriota bacterium]
MSLSRRRLLQTLAAAPAAACFGRASGVKIGMDSYTLRGFRWKALELIDYAAKVGLDELHFSEWPHIGSYDEVRDESYLRRVRAYADQKGVRLEMGTWGICPTNPGFKNKAQYGTAEEQLRFSIGIAKIFGSKAIRCVIGSGNLRREDGPIEKHIEATLQVFRNVRDDALRAGVHLAPENHKDLRATEMRELVEAAGTDYVGVTLDTGNPLEVLEDPLETVEILGPLAVGSHFRDGVLFEHPRGAAYQWTALGDGSVRIAEVIRRYIELAPGKPLALEIITGRQPAVLAFRDEEYMKAFPKLTPAELERFEKLARQGHPLMAGMMIPSNDPENPVFAEAVKEQQRVDFERSLRFLRDEIGL